MGDDKCAAVDCFNIYTSFQTPKGFKTMLNLPQCVK